MVPLCSGTQQMPENRAPLPIRPSQGTGVQLVPPVSAAMSVPQMSAQH